MVAKIHLVVGTRKCGKTTYINEQIDKIKPDVLVSSFIIYDKLVNKHGEYKGFNTCSVDEIIDCVYSINKNKTMVVVIDDGVYDLNDCVNIVIHLWHNTLKIDLFVVRQHPNMQVCIDTNFDTLFLWDTIVLFPYNKSLELLYQIAKEKAKNLSRKQFIELMNMPPKGNYMLIRKTKYINIPESTHVPVEEIEYLYDIRKLPNF
jgi:hypothetical protein